MVVGVVVFFQASPGACHHPVVTDPISNSDDQLNAELDLTHPSEPSTALSASTQPSCLPHLLPLPVLVNALGPRLPVVRLRLGRRPRTSTSTRSRPPHPPPAPHHPHRRRTGTTLQPARQVVEAETWMTTAAEGIEGTSATRTGPRAETAMGRAGTTETAETTDPGTITEAHPPETRDHRRRLRDHHCHQGRPRVGHLFLRRRERQGGQ